MRPFCGHPSMTRDIVHRAGSPRKAANQVSRQAQSASTLTDCQLKRLHDDFREQSNWSAKLSMEVSTLDPEQEWSMSEWNRLFKAVGSANFLAKIAWQKREKRCSRRSK